MTIHESKIDMLKDALENLNNASSMLYHRRTSFVFYEHVDKLLTIEQMIDASGDKLNELIEELEALNE